ncbi:unnamed protein product [Musa acuminata subsp. malaccensis]|uniref:(wild Malaysian banana) hypothetical protein n=1 Tax=Musa acuminata subsp. malaccensis TaxID=214687 RepID=A0A804KF80_MUSAM|nr:PREDICTED: uncharacterized protein LOC103997237 isoform X1 [Musa acuminata subsp. malaccensis]CAG1834024.1 unnamed protein product [Musa acuminata subsp. malaccensis]
MEVAKAEESTAPVAEFSIQALRLLSRSLLFLSTHSTHPLFGILAAASLLVILYLPRSLLSLVLSPVPISTFFLLAALLRHGSPPLKCPAAVATVDDGEEELTSLCPETKAESSCYHQEVIFSNDFISCGRRSRPLEIIYEEYEGEEEEERGGGGSHQYRGWLQNADLESVRLGSLGFTYAEEEKWGDGGSEDYRMWPQNADLGSRRAGPIRFAYGTDSDTESNGGSQAASEAEGSSSPEEHRLMWEDDEDGDDMIEIELELEEENMIEIDISGGR